MNNYFKDATVIPTGMAMMPFCCWKMERIGSRETKVPYDPKTGRRARVDSPETFGSMAEAVKAYGTGKYAGIGINISGSVGCIDVAHCITDGILSDAAQEIIDTFPDAYVEYSPSHMGLHLFFTVPEGFVFDRNRYFINNRNVGVEIYLPNATKHFITVTADVARAGNMAVRTCATIIPAFWLVSAALDFVVLMPFPHRKAAVSCRMQRLYTNCLQKKAVSGLWLYTAGSGRNACLRMRRSGLIPRRICLCVQNWLFIVGVT